MNLDIRSGLAGSHFGAAAIASKLAGAVWSPEDHQVDNRKLASALRIAAEGMGAIVRERTPVKK
jgi:glycine oxidase